MQQFVAICLVKNKFLLLLELELVHLVFFNVSGVRVAWGFRHVQDLLILAYLMQVLDRHVYASVVLNLGERIDRLLEVCLRLVEF